MLYEIGGYETYLKNIQKREKDQEDQEILDSMMLELKKKHEMQRKQKIAFLRDELEKMRM